MDTFREIFSRLPTSASQELVLLPPAVIGQIEEIRLRCGQLPRILYGKSEKTLTRITTREDLQKTLHNLIKFSYRLIFIAVSLNNLLSTNHFINKCCLLTSCLRLELEHAEGLLGNKACN